MIDIWDMFVYLDVSGLWENWDMFVYFDGCSFWEVLTERSNVNLNILILIYYIHSLIKYNDMAFISSKNKHFLINISLAYLNSESNLTLMSRST